MERKMEKYKEDKRTFEREVMSGAKRTQEELD